MNNFTFILVLMSYLMVLMTYYKINNINYLDKFSRSELNRLEPVMFRGVVRLIKSFIALTLSTGLYMTGFPYAGLVLACTMLFVWHQCYDIFKGLLEVQFKVTKDWVDKRSNLENRLKMHLSINKGEDNE